MQTGANRDRVLRTFIVFVVVSVLLAGFPLAVGAAEGKGRLTGGIRYQIPGWFKESFLELAEDTAEAALADKHVMLFMHLDECPYCAALIEESIDGSDYSAWLRKRFDAIAINIRGAREVAFNEDLVVTEKELAGVLKVRQTPTIIFLDGNNKVVMRSDGYRTPRDFRRILEYVDSKSYRSMSLPEFIARQDAGPHYDFREHRAFQSLADLSGRERPLMVLFEDAWCDACDLQHDTLLADPEVNELLGKLDVVRLDAESEAPLIDPAGNRTTPKAWSRALGMTTRPGIVLFDGPRELVRIEGVLRHWHFATALRYVADREFAEFPTLREYSRARRRAQLEAGMVIDLGRQ